MNAGFDFGCQVWFQMTPYRRVLSAVNYGEYPLPDPSTYWCNLKKPANFVAESEIDFCQWQLQQTEDLTARVARRRVARVNAISPHPQLLAGVHRRAGEGGDTRFRPRKQSLGMRANKIESHAVTRSRTCVGVGPWRHRVWNPAVYVESDCVRPRHYDPSNIEPAGRQMEGEWLF